MEATTPARDRQEEARLFFTSEKNVKRPQKPRRSSTAPSKTLAKTEALEKHVKTVNIRAEALATTEADFFKALIERQEEALKHLNELAAQLSQQNTATRSTQ